MLVFQGKIISSGLGLSTGCPMIANAQVKPFIRIKRWFLGGIPNQKPYGFLSRFPKVPQQTPKFPVNQGYHIILTLSGKRKKSAASSISVEKNDFEGNHQGWSFFTWPLFFFAFGNSVLERSADSASPGKKRDFCRGGPSKTESGFGLKWESFSRKQRLYV